jgi:uncharacterized protein (TIGR02246 family)
MNVHAESGAAAASAAATAVAEIRALIERCAKAFRDKDVDAVMACHTDDVVCFDCHSQFEARGAAEMRGFLEACMPHMQGPIVNEIHELAIVADRDVAFSHHHMRTSCRGSDGAEHGGWLRVSLGLRRVDGRWLASHAHISAPFDPMTNRTMFGLARDATPDWEGQACSGS